MLSNGASEQERAVHVNIEIMRAFVRLFLNPLNGLNRAKRFNDWNVWNGLRFRMMVPPESKKRKIGFLVEEKAASYGRR